MRKLKHSFLTVTFFAFFAFVSCEKESYQDENDTVKTVTNYELTKERFPCGESLNNNLSSTLLPLYFCSEYLGDYTPELYVNHNVYLNSNYVPSPSPSPSPNLVRYASWMTNLQSWLLHDFHDENPSGSNAGSIFMEFGLHGVDGSGALSAIDGNRVYNEVVCLLMDQLSVSSAGDLDDYEFYLYITVDFVCGNPVLYISGTAYN